MVLITCVKKVRVHKVYGKNVEVEDGDRIGVGTRFISIHTIIVGRGVDLTFDIFP